MTNHFKNFKVAIIAGLILSAIGYYMSRGGVLFGPPITGTELLGALIKVFSSGFILTFVVLELIRSFRLK